MLGIKYKWEEINWFIVDFCYVCDNVGNYLIYLRCRWFMKNVM